MKKPYKPNSNGNTIERNKPLIMEFKKLIKKALTYSCVYFTLITAIYMIILYIGNIGERAPAVEAPRVLLYFLASILLSIGNEIRTAKKLNIGVRYISHYVICIFAFYSCILLPMNMRPSHIFTGLILLTVLYLVIIAICAIFKSKLRANREKTSSYKNQFDTLNK